MRLNAPGDGGGGGIRRPSAATLRNGVKNGGRGLRSAARYLRRALTQPPPSIRVSPLLAELATADLAAALEQLQTSREGLSTDEAAARLEQHGPNVVGADQRHGRIRLFLRACLNPLVILLAVLALVSLATGDAVAAIVMTVMIVLGVGLRFMQEARADAAAEKLRAMIQVTATALRAGRPVEEPVARLVPGDVVQLSAGDMIPADVRILGCRDLFITQASLTGESLPVEKFETAGDTADLDTNFRAALHELYREHPEWAPTVEAATDFAQAVEGVARREHLMLSIPRDHEIATGLVMKERPDLIPEYGSDRDPIAPLAMEETAEELNATLKKICREEGWNFNEREDRRKAGVILWRKYPGLYHRARGEV